MIGAGSHEEANESLLTMSVENWVEMNFKSAVDFRAFIGLCAMTALIGCA